MATSLTYPARAGYQAQTSGEVNPHLHSSDNWLGWEAGKALAAAGRMEPASARKSRGHSVWIETKAMRQFTFKYDYRANSGMLVDAS